MSLNRYALSSPTLPFEDELLRAIGDDIVAHALAIGEAQHPLGSLYGLLPAFTRTAWVPLYPGLLDRRLGAELCVLWTNGTGAMGLPARRFTGVASVPDWSWSAFPCRVVFGRPGNHDPLSGAAPPRDTEWRAIDLDRGIDVVTQALGWSHVASLVLRSSWPYDFGTGGYGARAEEWSRRPVVQGGLRRVRHTTGNPADAKRLLPLAEELFESAGVKMVGLTLFHTAPGSQRRADPIVAAWDDALSGPLERDPAMRAVRAEEACRRRPQLQTLIEAWRSSERARLMA